MKEVLYEKKSLHGKDTVRRFTDFPINPRLSHFLFSTGNVVTTRKQEHLLDIVLGSETVVFEDKLTQGLGFALMIGCTEILERRQGFTTNNRNGPIVVVCHQIALKQQLVSSFCSCAQSSKLSYLVLEERPKEPIPDVDIVFLSSTFLSVVFSYLPQAPSMVLSTDLAAMPNLMSVLNKGRLIGFCNQASELEDFVFTQNASIVSFEEVSLNKNYRAYCSRAELTTWLQRTILDHSKDSVAVLCETEEEAIDIYNDLLQMGFRVFYMSNKRGRSYSERGVISLKRGELEVIVSTHFQQSADVHIFLSPPPAGMRFNKAITVHLDVDQGQEVPVSVDVDASTDVDSSDVDQEQEEPSVREEDSSGDLDETIEEQEDLIYDPPRLEHLLHQETERLFFQLLRLPAVGERRYAQQAARLLEHPLKEQLLSRLIGIFHKSSSMQEKRALEDRVFLEKRDQQRKSPRKKHSRGRRKGRFRRS
ncbi:MAG: hypothetical protein CMK59_10725 [Proteobacteria bacterium]|nr:hypothetical protein [Pseudomonadota bacterium]